MALATPDPRRETTASALLRSHRATLVRIARRHSLCVEDADDAVQRASLILLTRAPPIEPARLIGWMAVVTKHEAMAVRRTRERIVGHLAPEGCVLDPLEAIGNDAPGPAERVEQNERLAELGVALAALKANERLAILLQAQGYSYAEICDLCQWSYTKVNRCLAEGRARLRSSLTPAPGA